MISVVIPTYNRREELKDLLSSLKQQDCPISFEVIVVDDGSSDGTLDWLQTVAKEWDGKLRFFQQQNMGPGVARNLGISHARGNLIVFVDSDCIAPKEWLKNLTAVFTDSQVGAAGGPERCPPDDSLILKCLSYVMTSFLTTGGLRGKKGKKLGKYYPRSFNMAVRKQAVEAVGGVPNRYYGEDILLSYRVKQACHLLVYVPDAPVYHRRRLTLNHHFRQLFQMGKARIELACLHSSLLEPLYIAPAIALLSALVLGIGSIFSSPLFKIATGILIIAVLFLTTIGIDGSIRLKTAKAFFLIPFLFLVQQTAYGLGTITAALQIGRK